MQRRLQPRTGVLLGIVALGLVISILFAQQPPAAAAQPNAAAGRTRLDASDMRALRLRFEPGARSSWHSHAGWQIIAAEEGQGRTQVRGGEIIEFVPGGRPIYAGPGVVHWHGATPDEYLVQLTFISGAATSFGPVSEEDYLGR